MKKKLMILGFLLINLLSFGKINDNLNRLVKIEILVFMLIVL